MTDVHEWLTATKKLVDPDSSNPSARWETQQRTYLTGVSLPSHTGNGLQFPEMITRVDQRLEEFKGEFNQTVAAFLRVTTSLGSLPWSTLESSSTRSIIRFRWRKNSPLPGGSIILDVPNGKSAILSPEIYERGKGRSSSRPWKRQEAWPSNR